MIASKIDEPIQIAPLLILDGLTLFLPGKTGRYMPQYNTKFITEAMYYFRLHVFFKDPILPNFWSKLHKEFISSESTLKLKDWGVGLKELNGPLVTFGEEDHHKFIPQGWNLRSILPIKNFIITYDSWMSMYQKVGKGTGNELRSGNSAQDIRRQHGPDPKAGIKYKF